jgi:histidine triad (HIT) family protein
MWTVKRASLAGALVLSCPVDLLAQQSGPTAEPAQRCPLTAPYDPNNPFARILSGREPRSAVAESRMMIAILPLGWSNPGQALVIPRRAVRNLDDLSDAEMLDALHLIRRLAIAQRKAFGATGYTVTQNNARSQEVCHLHFHVIPNTPVQKVDKATRDQMDEIAAKLRAALPRR